MPFGKVDRMIPEYVSAPSRRRTVPTAYTGLASPTSPVEHDRDQPQRRRHAPGQRRRREVNGGTPTVANTTLIQVFGQGGNDTITLDEANGALPRANLFGGAGNDTLIGGSGGDMLFGQAGNDTLLGKGGADFLFGGARTTRSPAATATTRSSASPATTG
jgi:hypothetical protein